MNADKTISTLKGVGPETNKKLKILGIENISDLLHNYPRRYDDYSEISSIENIIPGLVTLRALIKNTTGRYVGRGMHITESTAVDKTSSVRLVWFNQPYREKSILPGVEYFISGEFALRNQRLCVQNPTIERADSFNLNTARIVPIYKETKGLKSSQIRKLVKQNIPNIKILPETLPAWLIKKEKLFSRSQAILAMHFPESPELLEKAKKRIGFEEVFELTLAALMNKKDLAGEHALNILFDKDLAKNFVDHLPFKLTDSQKKTVWQVYKDMEREQPMNRLIEGDVGSGKTIVAVMAAVMAIKQGFQVAFMAPTELLARQHADTICELLKPLGMEDKLGLLLGSLKPAQKTQLHAAIGSGKIQFIVGTHALISEKVIMHSLGLIIIDEQHRFGVQQRKKLQSKAGYMPHVMSMTATPIPRSLALTLYGEMDISVIDAKPPGRLPIKTTICSPNSRPQLYEQIDKQLANGRQMFVVCPLIVQSDMLSAESVENVFSNLKSTVFKHRQIGILHGKMKAEEKENTMKLFVNGKLDILVSTTVVEVGVNVPNATVMLIENAERFGLAQIHQLRGRVGRSSHQGHCYLMMGDSSRPSKRIRALEKNSDGFALAELDLEIRGPGAIYGTMQHGALDLRVAKLTDIKMIASARNAAQEFIDSGESLLQYNHLSGRISILRSVTNLN
ncbi:MAG: ATP-dependent DNA helicase RecG [Candidatus Saccharibacteria bacterium]